MILVEGELKSNVACWVSVQLDLLDLLVCGLISLLFRKLQVDQDNFGQGISRSHLVRWAQVLWDTLGQQPTAACARRPRWVWTQALADFSFAERTILVRWIKRWTEYRELTSSYTFLIQIGTCWDIAPKKLKAKNLKEIFGTVSMCLIALRKRTIPETRPRSIRAVELTGRNGIPSPQARALFKRHWNSKSIVELVIVCYS
jgi:hypothetical protein